MGKKRIRIYLDEGMYLKISLGDLTFQDTYNAEFEGQATGEEWENNPVTSVFRSFPSSIGNIDPSL